jgi:hypothetical protein
MPEIDLTRLPLGSVFEEKLVEKCPRCGQNGVWEGSHDLSRFLHKQCLRSAGSNDLYFGSAFCPAPNSLSAFDPGPCLDIDSLDEPGEEN